MITVSFMLQLPSLALHQLPTSAKFRCLCLVLLAMEKLVVAVLVAIRFNSGSAEDSGVVLFSVGFYLVVSRRYPKSVLQSAPQLQLYAGSH